MKTQKKFTLWTRALILLAGIALAGPTLAASERVGLHRSLRQQRGDWDYHAC